MDVKNTSLHGDLHGTVYMRPPPGYICSPNMVCRLKKSHYGLKQAPRAWLDKFRTAILHANFAHSFNDHTLFKHRTARGFTILFVYVGDIIISGNDTVGIDHLKC